MSRTKVVVLGGFGFIGGHLSNYLFKQGYEVTIFGHPREPGNCQFPDSIRCVNGYFSDAESVKWAVAGSDIVFHLLGNSTPMSSSSIPQRDIEENLLPTLSLFEYCLQAGVKQLIFISSGGTVYGVPDYLPIDERHPTAPICAYGINKLTIEHYMRFYSKMHGIDMSSIRLSNPYGPFQNIRRAQGIIGTYCENIVSNQSLQIWGDGSVVRDFIYIDDVVTALEKVIGKAQGYNVYNLGSGTGTSINELVSTLSRVTSRELEFSYLPGRDIDVPVNVLDISKFKKDFSWDTKISLEDGMGFTLAWHQSRKRENTHVRL